MKPASRSGFVVVLGGGITSNGEPGPATILRAQAGIQLALAHPELTIILSGGKANNSPLPEAELMARLFEQAGIGKNRLLLEDEARDTIGNAVLVAVRYLHQVKPCPLYLVTSPFHAARALSYFRGVLDRAWDLHLEPSAEAEGDEQRAATESGGIEWGRQFFAGIVPGDYQSLVARLCEQRPFYATLPRFIQRDRVA